MSRRPALYRSAALAAAALVLPVALSACSTDDDTDTGPVTPPTSQSAEPTTPTDPATDPSTEPATGVAAQVFGPACGAVPTSGKGSFDGMVNDPVATAASNNPLLGTLVQAVVAADLDGTLNDAEGITVFAPTDDAFAKLPPADLKAVLADKELLTKILTHHVVAGQLDPESVVGTHDTLAGDTVTVEGDVEAMTVEGASILCGNIPTANATVYVVDSVLMPAAS